MGFKDFASQVKLSIDQDSQIKYIEMVQEEENVDFKTAEKMAKGLTDPIIPEYTVGFKLVGAWSALIFQSKMKVQRDHYRAQFRELLTPPEIELFDRDYPDELYLEYQKEYKKRKKAAKKSKKRQK